MHGKFNNDGIWTSGGSFERSEVRTALFLDRDGVLVKETRYLSRIEDVELERGACELLAWARHAGHPIVVVTNQAGIARKYYDWAAFEAVQVEIARQLAARGCAVDLAIACPFHPDHTPGYSERHGQWRKPGGRMLQHAAELMRIDLSRSWMIGDHDSDIGAAKAAGLANAIHVLTGHGAATRQAALKHADRNIRVWEADDLVGAHRFLVGALSSC